MSVRLLIFGLGYTAARVAALVRARGGEVRATGSAGDLAFPRAGEAIGWATHILSSVPPVEESDPVLAAYGPQLARSPAWLGYLSSTGVYGDVGGGWVDETAPTGSGRRSARARADAEWLGLGARVFRLPGIYGPGRSALDRVREGRAHLVDLPTQVFSRVHVDDIAAGVLLAFHVPPGAYNLADDRPCSQDEVIRYAAHMLGLPPPPVVPLESLSPTARGFYLENRRVSNGKAKRVLDWVPAYPDYRFGLRAVSAITSPSAASSPPAAASQDQR